MIQTLTSRLEEIAEKYDRLQRMGTRPGERSGPAAGISADDLNSKLDEMLGMFGPAHPGEQLQRIEDRLGSLYELLEKAPPAAGRAGGHVSQSKPAAPPPAAAAPPPASAKPAEAGGGGKEDFWEAAKARLMGATGGSDAPKQDVPAASSGPSSAPLMPAAATPSQPVAAEQDLESVDEAPPPKPVGPEATVAELLAAVDERDKYITYMISRARRAEQVLYPNDWEALAEAPEDLKAAVLDLRDKLEQHLKESELSNSLERAALGRERAMLFKIKQQLEKQVRRLGLPGEKPEEPKAPPAPETNASEARWLRMFSSGKKES